MISLALILAGILMAKPTLSVSCDVDCPSDEHVVCGFNPISATYTMYPGKCAMKSVVACKKLDLIETPIYFCIKNEIVTHARKFYEEESCPVFCPLFYRPVCAASRVKSYEYRSFTNGCQLDMLNCRGDSETSEYVEVPLGLCPNHAMKNIFKDVIIATL